MTGYSSVLGAGVVKCGVEEGWRLVSSDGMRHGLSLACQAPVHMDAHGVGAEMGAAGAAWWK